MKLISAFTFYLLAMAVVGAGNSRPELNPNLQECINDMEDVIEFMTWDIQEGRIDSAIGAQYIENFQQTLTRLYELK